MTGHASCARDDPVKDNGDSALRQPDCGNVPAWPNPFETGSPVSRNRAIFGLRVPTTKSVARSSHLTSKLTTWNISAVICGEGAAVRLGIRSVLGRSHQGSLLQPRPMPLGPQPMLHRDYQQRAGPEPEMHYELRTLGTR